MSGIGSIMEAGVPSARSRALAVLRVRSRALAVALLPAALAVVLVAARATGGWRRALGHRDARGVRGRGAGAAPRRGLRRGGAAGEPGGDADGAAVRGRRSRSLPAGAGPGRPDGRAAALRDSPDAGLRQLAGGPHPCGPPPGRHSRRPPVRVRCGARAGDRFAVPVVDAGRGAAGGPGAGRRRYGSLRAPGHSRCAGLRTGPGRGRGRGQPPRPRLDRGAGPAAAEAVPDGCRRDGARGGRRRVGPGTGCGLRAAHRRPGAGRPRLRGLGPAADQGGPARLADGPLARAPGRRGGLCADRAVAAGPAGRGVHLAPGRAARL